jgi:hypothetical protein
MKKKIASLILALTPALLFAQTPFWTEDFGVVENTNNCDQGKLATTYTGPNGSWTMAITGPEADTPNSWFVSAQEQGSAVGTCGSTCGGNNRTLHLSNTTSLGQDVDGGAYYFEAMDMLCGLIPCGATSRRVQSPTINCSGKTDITLSFKYIEGGNAIDNATLWYSSDNGTNWTQLADMAKTADCGGGRGIWTAYSIALPASANNNSNVKIGFQWINNEDSDATDPSVAVDDIVLSTTDVVVTCCPGDFNCDGVVNTLDMLIIGNQFGCSTGCTADLNNDGIINAADMTIFDGLYGNICP